MSSDVIAHGLLGEILETVKRLEKKVDGMKSKSGGGAASDRDLDGPHGNPVIRKDPKRWDTSRGSFIGCHFSECPPEYLDVLAEFKDWQAMMDERKGTDDDKRKASFSRLDASRARGWANRLRNGWQATARQEAPPPGEDDIPF